MIPHFKDSPFPIPILTFPVPAFKDGQICCAIVALVVLLNAVMLVLGADLVLLPGVEQFLLKLPVLSSMDSL